MCHDLVSSLTYEHVPFAGMLGSAAFVRLVDWHSAADLECINESC